MSLCAGEGFNDPENKYRPSEPQFLDFKKGATSFDINVCKFYIYISSKG